MKSRAMKVLKCFEVW